MENVSPREFIKKLYKENKYLDTYGGSVVGAIAIILVVGWAVSYQYVQIHMNYLRQNWNNYKCHPGVMPFAGQIKLTPGMTPFQFTTSNFSYCLNEVLVAVVKRFMEPILNMNKVILKIFDNVLEAFKIVEKVFNRIKNIFESIINYIMAKTVSIYVPLQKILINLKDSFRKTGSIMGVLMYLIMGMEMAFWSGVRTFIRQIILALIIGVAAILAAFLFPPLWPLAIAAIVVWVLALVVTVAVYEWVKKIKNMTATFPAKPTKPEPPPIIKNIGSAIVSVFCFHPDTPVTMDDGSNKKMCDIKIGDILYDGNRVEAVMEIMGQSDNPFYVINSNLLGEEIMVTGSHKIFSKKQDKYVFVSEHEDAKKSIFWGEKMSCLITEDHTIPVGEYVFRDWED